jgi:hypothetical protein
MDILDFIINLLNFTDSENLVKKNWNVFTDKNEYLGERIIALLAFIVLMFCYGLFIFVILFAICKLLKKA